MRILNYIRKNFLVFLILGLMLSGGIVLRLYHIDFGLPHSWHADEPELGEFAIKYTYEFKDIVLNNNYYKLIPISYVYGTFPVYFLTLCTMAFSKFMNLINFSFDKTTLYIFMRSLNAFLSLVIVIAGGLLYKKIFKDISGLLVALFLLLFNWKFIVHAHYLNADIVVAELLILAFLAAVHYSNNPEKHRNTIVLGIFMGLAVGTKITAGLSLPFFVYLYAVKKDLKGFLAFSLTTLGAYMLSNPFSVIFSNDAAFRITQMLTKEGGLVFDSIDLSPFKYMETLAYVVNPIILGFGMYGVYKSLKAQLATSSKAKERTLHIFLVGNVLLYLVFFTLGARRVDRWLLPIIPLVLVYAAYGISKLWEMKRFRPLVVIGLVSYLVFPLFLLVQFQRNTPKSSAYLWLKDNTNPLATKLGITEEGLDPLNKLPSSDIRKFEVYEHEGAALTFPPDPRLYDYVIISSRPMLNFKRPEVIKKYPYYSQKWVEFENEVKDSSNFKLVKSFTLPKPNLVDLSDVFIYKHIN